MQHLKSSMESLDFTTRKMSVDVIYTIAKIQPIALKANKRDLIEMLNELRFDKIKPVREATIEALNAMKEVAELEITAEDL